MYPDWPRSKADLVPLPPCDGPKLKAFDFKGKQAIEVLEYAGEGLHAHVFKFRFGLDEDWIVLPETTDTKDRKVMTPFYNCSEPFSCECRAFGRLQEAGHENLAVDCFGYVLLDEDHERALHTQFPDKFFNGNPDNPHDDDSDEETNMCTRFLGRDGRKHPLRGIVKEFYPPTNGADLQQEEAKEMLRNIGRLQQLGIISLDVALRQMTGGRYYDFSKTITVPHYMTTPELSPHIGPEMHNAMELQAFILSIDDYLAFDEMIIERNRNESRRERVYICRSEAV